MSLSVHCVPPSVICKWSIQVNRVRRRSTHCGYVEGGSVQNSARWIVREIRSIGTRSSPRGIQCGEIVLSFTVDKGFVLCSQRSGSLLTNSKGVNVGKGLTIR